MKNIVDQLLSNANLRAKPVSNHGLTSRVLWIGPEEAKALLVANNDNRKIRLSRVQFYARVMQAGNWRLTHQGIAFDINGIGIDLQHRLNAIILSGVTVQMLVSEGLGVDAFAATDRHERRTVADSLKLRKTLIEEAKFFHAIMKTSNPTEAETGEMCYLIEPQSDEIQRVCSTHSKILSTASVRCAAIVLMMEHPKFCDEITEKYRNLVLRRSELWSPCMHAFSRKITSIISSSSEARRIDLYSRALVALDPHKSALTKIQLSSPHGPADRAIAVLDRAAA